MSSSQRDEEFMRRVLELAAQGTDTTRPNPMVGALIVKDGEVIASSYHVSAGGPHAEISALKIAGEAARGSTVYINLEPCSHHGRTPPCAQALIDAGVKRVVAGIIDPNPQVSGSGIAMLEAAGIDTKLGVLEDECRALNLPFILPLKERRPHITVKLACSLDGKIATRTGDSRWITSPPARQKVHALRAESDAIMVGTGTAALDDPMLTVRDAPLLPHGQPLRVVLDRQLRLPQTLKLWDTRRASTLLICADSAKTDPAAYERIAALESRGVIVAGVQEEGGKLRLDQALAELAARGVQRLFVEGGAELAGSMLDQELVDRLIIHQAPLIIGGRDAPGVIGGDGVAKISEIRRPVRIESQPIGPDTEHILYFV